ncbi:hypothetical protein D3C72_1339580 [compost metagenome]
MHSMTAKREGGSNESTHPTMQREWTSIRTVNVGRPSSLQPLALIATKQSRIVWSIAPSRSGRLDTNPFPQALNRLSASFRPYLAATVSQHSVRRTCRRKASLLGITTAGRSWRASQRLILASLTQRRA